MSKHPQRRRKAAPPSLARPQKPASAPDAATQAAAAAVGRESQQRLRQQKLDELIASMCALVSGYAAGDVAMAIGAVGTVLGQVVAFSGQPPAALAQAVSVAQKTYTAIVRRARDQAAADSQKTAA